MSSLQLAHDLIRATFRLEPLDFKTLPAWVFTNQDVAFKVEDADSMRKQLPNSVLAGFYCQLLEHIAA